eukprot:g13461.t1
MASALAPLAPSAGGAPADRVDFHALVLSCNRDGMEALRKGQSKAAFEQFKYAEAILIANQAESGTSLAAVTCNNLGCYYKKVGKLHGALSYLRRALQMEVDLGTDEVTLAGTNLNICAILSKLEKHDKAVQHALAALELIDRKTSSSDPATIPAAGNLKLYHNVAIERDLLHQYDKAAAAFHQGFEVAKRCLGEDHPLSVTLGKNAEAVLLKSQKMTKGNPDTATMRKPDMELHRFTAGLTESTTPSLPAVASAQAETDQPEAQAPTVPTGRDHAAPGSTSLLAMGSDVREPWQLIVEPDEVQKEILAPQSLEALQASLGVEPGQVLLARHPRHDRMYVVERLEQISTGQRVAVASAKKRIFISAQGVKNKAVVWYAGATVQQIERAIAKAANLEEGAIELREDVVVLSTSLPNDLHLEVYPVARAKSGRGATASDGGQLRRVKTSPVGPVSAAAASAASQRLRREASPRRNASPPRNRPGNSSVGGSTTPTAHQSAPEEHCVYVLAGHTGSVLCLCGVGDILFTGSQDSSIMIWDLNNLQYIGTLPGHRGFVKCLHASYAKKVLCSGSQDRTVRVWSLDSFSTVKVLQGHTGGVNAVLILESTDAFRRTDEQFPGDLLVSGSEDRSIRVWDLTSFDALCVLEQSHLGGVFALASFGAAGTAAPSSVVSGARDRSLKVWDTSTWSVNRTLHPPHYDGVSSIADGVVKVWDGELQCQELGLRRRDRPLASQRLRRPGTGRAGAAGHALGGAEGEPRVAVPQRREAFMDQARKHLAGARKVEGTVAVGHCAAIKPLCDELFLDYKSQRQQLRRQLWSAEVAGESERAAALQALWDTGQVQSEEGLPEELEQQARLLAGRHLVPREEEEEQLVDRCVPGTCFVHRRYGYRGVVLCCEPWCTAAKAWKRMMGVAKLPRGELQPFYHCFLAF